MNLARIASGALLSLLLAACSRSPELPVAELAAGRPGSSPPSTLLRLARAGGVPKLYRLPSLEEIKWERPDKLPAVKRIIGADPEQRLVFFVDAKDNAVSFDLETRRSRTVYPQVRQATIGADGTVFLVDSGGTVLQLVRRAPVRFRRKLTAEPQALFPAMNGVLLARVGSESPELQVIRADQEAATLGAAPGDAAASRWGDVLAIASDDEVSFVDPQGKRPNTSIDVSNGARAVGFSPSGHRLYVATGDEEILVVDRFGREVLAHVELPGSATAVRSDGYGGWLLARPAEGDSIWVVDATGTRWAGTVPGRWGEDLPEVGGLGTLVVRQGRDVAAIALSDSTLPERGRIEGGADDFYLPLPWSPETDQPSPDDVDSTVVADGDSAAAGPEAPNVYLQVSSSKNPEWANELSGKLRSAGLPASVLRPRAAEDNYRVVLGPYGSREEAEEASRKIGMPSFVISAQPTEGVTR